MRAYVSMADFEERNPYYTVEQDHYDAERDLYSCSQEIVAPLHPLLHREAKQVPSRPQS